MMMIGTGRPSAALLQCFSFVLFLPADRRFAFLTIYGPYGSKEENRHPFKQSNPTGHQLSSTKVVLSSTLFAIFRP